MSPDDWRLTEALKMIRQLVTCPYCGALISTADGLTIHTQWHDGLMGLVNQIDTNFNLIFDYVTNPETGLEKRFNDLVGSATNAINTLRTDATTAITDSNNSVSTLRTDATTALNATSTRIAAIETEVTRVPGGIWNRLQVLESDAGISATLKENPMTVSEGDSSTK